MAGRGRGRGGRGGGMSMNREQLSAIGVGVGEALPGPITEPPPLFPLLNRKPVPLTDSIDFDYLVLLQQDFINRMQQSGTYIKLPSQQKKKLPQEIDKLLAQLPSAKEKFDWQMFPVELRPKVSARRTHPKAVKDVDVESTLNKLEELEDKVEETANTSVNEKEVKAEDEDETMEYVEEVDEEMDDGTDYANNYFDNGEDYDDEDDNLDDGPVY